jgi:hypothetical protein
MDPMGKENRIVVLEIRNFCWVPSESSIRLDVQGVVKLGWSWENRFVVSFNSLSHLQARLKELMNQPGCLATYCIVQEGHLFDHFSLNVGKIQLVNFF